MGFSTFIDFFFFFAKLLLRIVKVSKYRYRTAKEKLYSELKVGLQHVGGALTLWALLAGAVERLEVQPLAVFAPSAR